MNNLKNLIVLIYNKFINLNNIKLVLNFYEIKMMKIVMIIIIMMTKKISKRMVILIYYLWINYLNSLIKSEIAQTK